MSSRRSQPSEFYPENDQLLPEIHQIEGSAPMISANLQQTPSLSRREDPTGYQSVRIRATYSEASLMHRSRVLDESERQDLDSNMEQPGFRENMNHFHPAVQVSATRLLRTKRQREASKMTILASTDSKAVLPHLPPLKNSMSDMRDLTAPQWFEEEFIKTSRSNFKFYKQQQMVLRHSERSGETSTRSTTMKLISFVDSSVKAAQMLYCGAAHEPSPSLAEEASLMTQDSSPKQPSSNKMRRFVRGAMVDEPTRKTSVEKEVLSGRLGSLPGIGWDHSKPLSQLEFDKRESPYHDQKQRYSHSLLDRKITEKGSLFKTAIADAVMSKTGSKTSRKHLHFPSQTSPGEYQSSQTPKSTRIAQAPVQHFREASIGEHTIKLDDPAEPSEPKHPSRKFINIYAGKIQELKESLNKAFKDNSMKFVLPEYAQVWNQEVNDYYKVPKQPRTKFNRFEAFKGSFRSLVPKRAANEQLKLSEETPASIEEPDESIEEEKYLGVKLLEIVFKNSEKVRAKIPKKKVKLTYQPPVILPSVDATEPEFAELIWEHTYFQAPPPPAPVEAAKGDPSQLNKTTGVTPRAGGLKGFGGAVKAKLLRNQSVLDMERKEHFAHAPKVAQPAKPKEPKIKKPFVRYTSKWMTIIADQLAKANPILDDLATINEDELLDQPQEDMYGSSSNKQTKESLKLYELKSIGYYESLEFGKLNYKPEYQQFRESLTELEGEHLATTKGAFELYTKAKLDLYHEDHRELHFHTLKDDDLLDFMAHSDIAIDHKSIASDFRRIIGLPDRSGDEA